MKLLLTLTGFIIAPETPADRTFFEKVLGLRVNGARLHRDGSLHVIASLTTTGQLPEKVRLIVDLEPSPPQLAAEEN